MKKIRQTKPDPYSTKGMKRRGLQINVEVFRRCRDMGIVSKRERHTFWVTKPQRVKRGT